MKVVYFVPPGFGYSTNQILEGLWLLTKNGEIDKLVCTDKVVHHGAKLVDLPLESVGDALTEVDDADIILFGSDGDVNYLKDTLPRIPKKKLQEAGVFIDGGDSNQYLVDPVTFRLYLKRELRYPEAHYLQWQNVRGFTFGVYDFHFDQTQPGYDQRDIDVAFVAFGGSSPLRKACVDWLNANVTNTGFKIYAKAPGDCQPLSIDEYRSVMRRSKVIINITGAGVDTLRFWEAMGFGAILCSQDIRHHLFVRDLPEARRHVFYFDGWQKMLELCGLVVNDSKRWAAMRQATDSFIRCNHSTQARARQLIQLFRELA